LHGGFLQAILYCIVRKFGCLQKGTSFCNFSQTQDLEENFATASRHNSSTLALVDDTYDGRRVVAVYYTSVNCNPLTRLLRFVVDLWYNLFRQLCVWFRLTSASRGPSASVWTHLRRLPGARRAHRVYDAQRCRPERLTDETNRQQLQHDAALMFEVLCSSTYSTHFVGNDVYQLAIAKLINIL